MRYHVEFDIDFKRNEFPGRYIVLEGIDGSGKTTQAKLLQEYFEKQGKKVVATREPRKNVGVIGDLIQKILHGETSIPPVAFQYLFSADREIHHEELILPSLKDGKVVISDRCFWSAIPYGMLDREGDFNEETGKYMLVAQSILSLYHQFTVPDQTFYLDISLNVAMKRIQESGSKTEIYEDSKKLEKTLKGYMWLLQEFPKEFTIINGEKSVEEVTQEIISKLPK